MTQTSTTPEQTDLAQQLAEAGDHLVERAKTVTRQNWVTSTKLFLPFGTQILLLAMALSGYTKHTVARQALEDRVQRGLEGHYINGKPTARCGIARIHITI